MPISRLLRMAVSVWLNRGARLRDAISSLSSSLALVVSVVVVLMPGCAGYQVGNQSLYPADVRTVAVHIFESTSFRRNLGEMLTEAVVKYIEQETPFKVVPDSQAETILTGKIITETKRQTLESPTDESRQSEISMNVQVRWVDNRGKVLHEGSIVLPDALASAIQNAQLTPEFGQTVATTQQQAITRLAKKIVSLMEVEWHATYD